MFIHPRPGLITESLSEHWFALCRYAVAEAKKLEVQVWLHDGKSYPSGFAGGHVPAEVPESYVEGGELILNRYARLTSGEAGKCAVLLKRTGGEFREVQSAGSQGEYYCFEKARYSRRA